MDARTPRRGRDRAPAARRPAYSASASCGAFVASDNGAKPEGERQAQPGVIAQRRAPARRHRRRWPRGVDLDLGWDQTQQQPVNTGIAVSRRRSVRQGRGGVGHALFVSCMSFDLYELNHGLAAQRACDRIETIEHQISLAGSEFRGAYPVRAECPGNVRD